MFRRRIKLYLNLQLIKLNEKQQVLLDAIKLHGATYYRGIGNWSADCCDIRGIGSVDMRTFNALINKKLIRIVSNPKDPYAVSCPVVATKS